MGEIDAVCTWRFPSTLYALLMSQGLLYAMISMISICESESNNTVVEEMGNLNWL